MQPMHLSRKLLAIMLAALLLPAPAFAQKILRYTDHEPLGGMRTRFINEVFFAAVEKESKGRLKIQANWDGKLATGYDALGILGEGAVADIGIVVPEYKADKMPLHQIFKSFLAGPTGARQVAFLRRAYTEVPAFPAELEKNNVVHILFTTGYPVAFFSSKSLTTLDDIRKQKWRSASFWHRDFLANAGASPVTMRWGPEVLNALKNKTLDGLMVNIDSGYMLKVHEVAPNVLASRDMWLGHVYLLVMNKKIWDGLAQEDKDAIRRAAETAYKALGPIMDASFDAMVNDIKKEGINIRLLEAREVAAFQKTIKFEDVQGKWAKEQEGKEVKDAAVTIEIIRALLTDAMK